jgi:hypothetical protein
MVNVIWLWDIVAEKNTSKISDLFEIGNRQSLLCNNRKIYASSIMKTFAPRKFFLDKRVYRFTQASSISRFNTSAIYLSSTFL